MPTELGEQMFQHRSGRRGAFAQPQQDDRRGVFSRMRESLSKSRRAMTQQLTAVMFDPADGQVWERLEEALMLCRLRRRGQRSR